MGFAGAARTLEGPGEVQAPIVAAKKMKGTRYIATEAGGISFE